MCRRTQATASLPGLHSERRKERPNARCMGAGASRGLEAAIMSASAEDLQAALDLPADVKDKLRRLHARGLA